MAALSRFGKLDIPSYSLEALISAIFLFIASLLFAALCPPRIKQFSSEEWCYQLKYPILTYWSHAWRYPPVRIACAFFYFVGGGLAIWIISVKLVDTIVYICRNM
jgi:hypothetical protein